MPFVTDAYTLVRFLVAFLLYSLFMFCLHSCRVFEVEPLQCYLVTVHSLITVCIGITKVHVNSGQVAGFQLLSSHITDDNQWP